MTSSLLIIFGLPGAGKSYVAHILDKHFGYFVYDGDTDIPERMKTALFKKEIITDTMRKEFLGNMIASTKKLVRVHNKLAIHQTFLKEFMRNEFLAAYPQAQFLLIESPDAIREQRYMKRKYFNLGLPYLRHMSALFEKPMIKHEVILNNEDGSEKIVNQLDSRLRGNDTKE